MIWSTSTLVRQCKNNPPHGALWPSTLNSVFRLRQNGFRFAEDILKIVFLNKNPGLISISLHFFPKAYNCWHVSMTPIRHQAIIWTNAGLGCWCIHGSLGRDDLLLWNRRYLFSPNMKKLLGRGNWFQLRFIYRHYYIHVFVLLMAIWHVCPQIFNWRFLISPLCTLAIFKVIYKLFEAHSYSTSVTTAHVSNMNMIFYR